MPRPCPSCCDDDPIIECPARLKLRVRNSCVLFGPGSLAEGAIVTARDQAEVFDDATGLTDENGLVELELEGPGTFDVHITIGECTEIIEGVTLIECEVKTLPDVAPCCGEICVEVYDYDTAAPIAGADVNGMATDSEGLACFSQFAGQSSSFISVTASGYLNVRGTMLVCFPCDCETTQNHPVSMFSSSTYVAGGAVGAVHDCLGVQDCLLGKIARPRNVFRRIMYADFAGPEAIFGSSSSGVEVEWDPAEGTIGAWVGWTSGGYGYRVTRVFDAATNTFTETARERFDFPVARVRVVAITNVSIGSTRLEWSNYIDAEGTIKASPTHVFETSGTPGTTGYTTVALVPETYCTFDVPFPFEVWNDFAPSGSINLFGDPITTAALTGRWSLGLVDSTPASGHYFRAFNSGMCAPADVSGAFWVGFGGFGLCTSYDTIPSANFALYE